MRASLEFLIGLLDLHDPSCVAAEDLDGEHGPILQTCHELGFLSSEPAAHPVASCPYCADGVPYRLGERCLCHTCRSVIDPRHLLLWQLDREAFLCWIARGLRLR